MNPKISVIVPMYNSSKTIKTTLDSIISQDFNSFEIIVVDDGSTDNSFEIADNKLKNTKIPYKIIHQKNSGVSAARNKAMNIAKGEYFVFVDSDDYILTNHLKLLYNPDYDFSLIQLVKKDSNASSKAHVYSESEISCYDFIKKELKMEIPFNFCQLSYRASLIKDNDLKFNPKSSYGEDSEFALKALSFGDKISISNEVSYFYIQHSQSATSTLKLKRFEFVNILENLKDFYKKQGNTELAGLIITSRIPKAIFGNMNYFFYNDYKYDDIVGRMNELDLFKKLSEYEGDFKFKFKIRLFLLSPKIYYKMWKRFKNSI